MKGLLGRGTSTKQSAYGAMVNKTFLTWYPCSIFFFFSKRWEALMVLPGQMLALFFFVALSVSLSLFFFSFFFFYRLHGTREAPGGEPHVSLSVSLSSCSSSHYALQRPSRAHRRHLPSQDPTSEHAQDQALKDRARYASYSTAVLPCDLCMGLIATGDGCETPQSPQPCRSAGGLETQLG